MAERIEHKGMFTLDIIALVLVIIGGLNWLLVGVFNWNLVSALLGGFPVLERFVYIVVGISAVFVAAVSPMLLRHVKMERAAPPPATGTY